MQRIIQKKKQEVKEQTRKENNRPIVTTNKSNYEPKRENPRKIDIERKISVETEAALKPKYSHQKNKASQGKNSVRDSVTSKKSAEKQQTPLNRANSKRSIKSNNSSSRLSRSKNNSKEKHEQSFDRFSQKNDDCLHSEQLDLAKDMKKMNNL